MDFSWEAMQTADARVKQLRRRMADWGGPAEVQGETAKAFDARFREAISGDLDMPRAVVVVNELVASPDVPDGQKYSLLASWDQVLGLDLEQEAMAEWQPTDEMRSLIDQRDSAREAKDFQTSDELRDRLQSMGLEVMDTPEGTKVRPRS
jgi:cysteinyl-tRNA synthetase